MDGASIVESGGVSGEVAFAGDPQFRRRYLDYREWELTVTLGGTLAQGLYLEEGDALTSAVYAYGDDWETITDCAHDLAG